MEKLMTFTKNTGLVAFGLLVLFVGVGAISVVFEAISWQTLGDWTLKAVAVAAIVVAVGAVCGLIVSAASKSK